MSLHGSERTPGSFWVLLADLESSRRVRDRSVFSTTLDGALEAASQRESAWYRPPVRVKGVDEWSSVLAGPLPEAFKAIRAVNLAVHPHRFRFGLGYGAIDVEPDAPTAARMDGPAFHAGARALELAERADAPLRIATSSGGPIEGCTEEARYLVGSVESLVHAHSLLVRRWTPSQVEVIRRLANGGHSPAQKDIALDLGVSPQTISKHLKRAEVDAVMELEESIRAGLELLGRMPELLPSR